VLKNKKKFGADIDVDVSYQWLTFFLDDDKKLKDIHDKYKSGEMMTSEVKKNSYKYIN